MVPKREFLLLSKYLLGVRVPTAMAERYAAACEVLGPQLGTSSALLRTARRWPWLLPYLDAAAGLLRPTDPLRKRLLLAAAILEASPEFHRRYLPVRSGRLMLLWRVGWTGIRAVSCLAVGAVLLLFLQDDRGEAHSR